ncbi:hypothetical protein [Coraliomargarita akajimensis]|nr:hypothetical protein [Coraliomargarita akajimensis]
MSNPTNQDEPQSVVKSDSPTNSPATTSKAGTIQAKERRFATDWFMLFAYGLFAIALCIQFGLIIWLDLF